MTVAIVETLAQTTVIFSLFVVQTNIRTKQRYVDLNICIVHLGSKHTPQYYLIQNGVYNMRVKYVYSSIM